jgi:hypothetical protein
VINNYVQLGIDRFLFDNPGMAIQPTQSDDLVIRGRFDFKAKFNNLTIEDYYYLEICINQNFPNVIPIVKETDQKIPKIADYHVFKDDRLCFGAKLILLMKIKKDPTLSGFAENCLVPYLYAMSYKLRNGGEFIFGELEHGVQGILNEYKRYFGLTSNDQVLKTLKLISNFKKRIANKKMCPCGCNRKLTNCSLHNKVTEIRKNISISCLNQHILEIEYMQQKERII